MDRIEMLEEGRMLRQGDRTAAWEYYQRVIQKAAISMDQDLWVHSSLAFAWELIDTCHTGSIAQAQEILAQVLPVSGEASPYVRLVQGQLHMLAGEFTEAIALLQSISAEEDLEFQGYVEVMLGRCWSVAHNFAAATTHFDRAASLLTEESTYFGFVCLYQGEMHLYAQSLGQAEASLQAALDTALLVGDDHLATQVTYQMACLALARQQWDTAQSFLQDAEEKLDEELDCHTMVQIALTRLEIYCAQKQLSEAIDCWEEAVTPLLPHVQDWRVTQRAGHLEGRLRIAQLAAGMQPFGEESIEKVEDLLLDIAVHYDQQKVASCHAQALRTLATLYHFALQLATPYQYQGKSLRSLEQALEVLKGVGLETSPLGQEIQDMYDQMLDGQYQLST